MEKPDKIPISKVKKRRPYKFLLTPVMGREFAYSTVMGDVALS